MKAIEFAYWLQGYFEINGDASALTNKQAAKVLEKANGVQSGTDAVELKAQNFVSYTQGVISSLSYVTPTAEALTKATADLKGKLNDLFFHAIDPAVPGDQAVHKRNHRPEPPDGGRLDLLC